MRLRGIMIVRSGAAGALALCALLMTGCASQAPATLAAAVSGSSERPGFHEDEGKLGRTPAADLARTLGCPDFEPQERAPGVAAQVSCGLNGHLVYVQTFTSSHVPKKYVQGGPGPTPTGADVIGPDWIVHVDDASYAPTVQAELGGQIVPAS
jgi:hypothetical protein